MSKEYNEVMEILKYIPKSDFEKIPKQLLNTFNENIERDYKFSYDINKTLDEQNVSKKAKTIIAILYRDYWAPPDKKEKIIRKEKYDKEEQEKIKREKYNSDDIFKNKQENTYESENLPIKVEKENFLKKIIKYIKRLLVK